jgi:antitoxin component YwqK of YwqJK toxin-antitoxin module
MSSIFVECKAITKSGEKCKRNATKDGYCKQHFEMYNEQAISSDVMRNIVSDYIPYDELKELENQIDNLKINEGRIVKKRTNFGDGFYTITIKIDDKLRKAEKYNKNDVKMYEYNYDKDENLDGKQHYWYDNGNKWYEDNYLHGKTDGLQLLWWDNGNLKSESNYSFGEKYGIQKEYNENGYIKNKFNYLNGLLQGVQKEYNENGILIKTEEYDHGVKIS